MAKKRINKDDIAPKNIFENVEMGAKEAKAQVDLLVKALGMVKQTASKTKTSMGASPQDVKTLKEHEALTKRANQTAQVKLQIDKKLLVAKEQLKQATQRQNAQTKLEVQLQNAEVGSLKRLRLESKKLIQEKDRLNLSTKQGAQRLREINRQLNANNAVLDKNATKLGKQKNNIGNYKSALSGLTRVLGQLGIAFGVFTLIRNSFNVIKDFEQSQADLASVLGVSVTQMEGLTKQAKELGAATTFTASQVAELQKELAKLGFSQTEIEQMTEATLLLAEATGTDLARAAEVTGATLNGFGLSAEETQRVVDVMAKSFSSSSLDMEKFSTAMAAVAPIAKTMGFSIEETTSMLGTLTDSGLDASTAGTSLRNMMLEAKRAGLTWQEALDKVNNSQDKAATSLELFGKRGVAAGVILAENQEKVGGLTEKLLEADGAAEKMADTQRNTLGGALKLLQSAWEGQILGMNEAGKMSTKLTKIIKFLADNIGTILKTLGKLIVLFVAYKAVIAGIKLREKILDLIQYNKALTASGSASQTAAKGTKAFGTALKSIGFAAIIALLIEIAQRYHDIASGAARARHQTDLFNKVNVVGSKKAEEFLRNNNSRLERQIKLIKESTRSESEKTKAIQSATDASKGNVEAEIKRLRRLKDIALEEKKARIAEVARRRAEQAKFQFGTGDLAESARLGVEIELLDQTIAREKGLSAAIVALKASIQSTTPIIDDITVSTSNSTDADKKKTKALKDQTKALKDLTDEIIRQGEVEKQIRDEKEAFDIESVQLDLEDEIKAEEERVRITGKINTDHINRLIAEEDRLRRARIESRFLDAVDASTSDVDVELALQQRNQELIRLDEEMANKRKSTIDTLNQAQEDYADKVVSTTEEIKESYETQIAIIDALTEAFVKNADKRIAKIDEEIDAAQKQADMFREMAINGNITAKESLAEQNRLIEEANAEKARQEERKQNILKISAIIQTYLASLEAGDDQATALGKAATTGAALELLVNTIGSFFEGTEDTGTVANPLDSKGGRLAMLHDNERVLTAKQNAKMRGYSNDEVANIMERHRMNGMLDGQIGQGRDSHLLVQQLMDVKGELKEVKKAIIDKPETNIELGAISQKMMQISETRKQGNRTTRKRFKLS